MTRRLAGTALLVLLVGCGGSTPAPPPPPPVYDLTMTCGGYNAGAAIGVVLAMTLDPVPATAVTLPVSGGGVARNITCPAGQRVCLIPRPDLTAFSVDGNFTWVLTTDVGHGPQAFTCRVDPDALLPQPAGTAVFEAGQVRVSWPPVTGAVRYRATLRSLGFATGVANQELATATTSATELVLPFAGAAPGMAVVELEAWAMDPASSPAGALTPAMARRSRQDIPLATGPISLRPPVDFTGNTLDLHVAEGQRLAVLLLNISWVNPSPATIQATGTAPYPLAAKLAVASPPSAAASPAAASPAAARPAAARPSAASPGVRCLPPRASAARPSAAGGSFAGPLAALAPVAAPLATRDFCVLAADVNGNFTGSVTRAAHLARESTTANFYLDDRIASDLTAGDWDVVIADWEETQRRVVAIAGPPHDLDGNGKTTVVFTDAFGPVWGGWTVQGSGPANTTLPCNDGTAADFNGGETFFITNPSALGDADGLPLSRADAFQAISTILPHEFQHIVDLSRAATWQAPAWYDGWMLEGRASLMEDLVGQGLHTPLVFIYRNQIFHRGGPEGYDDLSLTTWQGKGVNYSGVQFLFQYLADRLGTPFITALYQGEGTGMGLLERASGLPFPQAFALWTSALLFSNEPASPGPLLDYTGADWTPLHTKVAPFQYGALDPGAAVPMSLRSNGFDVYVTGPAGPGGGTVTVGSTLAQKPWVVAIPFTGALP